MRCFNKLTARGSGKKGGQMAAYVCPSAVKLLRSYILTPLCGGGRRLRFLTAHKNPQPCSGKPQGFFDSAHTSIFDEPWSQWNCISPLWATSVRLDLGVKSAPLVLQGKRTVSVVKKLLSLHPPSLDLGNFLFRHGQKRTAAARCE